MSPRAAVVSQVFEGPSGGKKGQSFWPERLKLRGRETEEKYMTNTNSTLSNIDRIGGAIMDSLDRVGLLALVGLVAWVITTSLLA